MPYLVERPVLQQDAGRAHEAHGLPLHVQFDAAVRGFRDLPELVDGEEVRDAVAQRLRHAPAVLAKRLRGLGRLPAAVRILKCLRQVPVVERGERLDAGGFQFVHEAVIEVEPFRVRPARAIREDAWPGDGEAVGVAAEAPHQRDVFLVTMVVIVGDVSGVAVPDLPGRVCERVPDRGALAVLVPRAFNLVCRRGGAPEEALRELAACRRLGRGVLPRLRPSDRRLGRRAADGQRGDRRTRCGLPEIATRYFG